MKKKELKPPSPLQKFRTQPGVTARESSPESVLVQEVEIAQMVGGRRHGGSGASMFSKSDGSSQRYQIEAKQTKHAQHTLKLEWLIKISREALGRSRVPFLSLRFLNTPKDVEKDWIVLPRSEFEDLYRKARGESPILNRWEE